MSDELIVTGRALRGTNLRCPADGARLIEVERADVHIDACPECRGVWLDRGELDRILVKERELLSGDDDFFREVEGGRARPASRERQYDDDDHHEEKRPRRRRRGLLEELLDFD